MSRNKITRNLIGKKFGKITVIKKIQEEYGQRKCPLWECKCECGKTKNISEEMLLYYPIKSCGCLQFRDLSNKKFGKLIVQKDQYRQRNNKYKNKEWLCKCDCGKEKWVSQRCLITGGTKTCGCLDRRNLGLEHSLSAKRTCYSHYKRTAKNVNREFNLTFDEFIEITSLNCLYCNSKPSNVKTNRAELKGNYIYNGIDRVDSKRGYTKDNCVPCCKICNTAKSNMDLLDFKNWIGKVHDWVNYSLE